MNRNEVFDHSAFLPFGLNPLVSVIVPVYNAEKYLREALHSLLADNYQPKEIIVVDDGSNDKSAEIIRAFGNLIYKYQENQGVSAARNVAIQNSYGEFITFLDSDDVWIPGRIQKSVEYFRTNPETDFVLGMSQRFLDEGVEKPERIKQEWLDVPQFASNTGVLMARRYCFERIGLFNPDYKFGEDTEWIQRANDAGLIMARLPVLFLNQRVHEENIAVRNALNIKNSLLKIMRESVQRKKEAGL